MDNQLYRLLKYLDPISSDKIIRLANMQVYKIKAGDTLSKITDNDTMYIKLILEANPDLNPNKLKIDQEIILPPPPVRPNDNLNYSNDLIDHIKKYEGNNGQPYLTSYDDGFGNITIGWGHNLGKLAKHKTISLQEANDLLLKDLDKAAAFVRKNISAGLTQGKFDALISLVFNAGSNAVYNTNLFKLIDKGKFISALYEFPNTLIGENQGGLIQRRLDETKMFAS